LIDGFHRLHATALGFQSVGAVARFFSYSLTRLLKIAPYLTETFLQQRDAFLQRLDRRTCHSAEARDARTSRGLSIALENAKYVFNNVEDLSGEIEFKKDGIIVLEVREGGTLRAAGRPLEFKLGGGRVRLGDLANATRQLATLLSSGLPLMDSLTVLVEQEEAQALKAALSSVRDAVREGASLADALKVNPKFLEGWYCLGIVLYRQYIGFTSESGEWLMGKVWQTGQLVIVDDYDT
jgi:hypothetical protein